MAEFVQSFKFRVRLTRSTSPGPTLSPPPKIGSATLSRISTPPGSAPAVGGAGAAPLGSPGQTSETSDRPAAPDKIGEGAFQECNGLEIESDVREYIAGGRNAQVIRRIGRVKVAPVVLKRGMLLAGDEGYVDPVLWNWIYGIVAGDLPVPRYDGAIEALDPADVEHVLAHWTFARGLPAKVVGPQFNALTGAISIEEVTIHHEGLRLEQGA
jgi:phage tail-like protein